MNTKKYISHFLEGAGIELNGNRSYDMQIVDPRIYNEFLFFQPTLKMGEAYVKGWWDCEKLDQFFFKICRHYHDKHISTNPGSYLTYLKNKFFNSQTKIRSKKVAEIHYNLGNDLYKAMLGDSMAYTCGYWKNTNSLDQAQYNKFDLICRKINLQRGDNVLELGCGWGSFAKFAAETYGCKVAAVNISSEQVRYGRESCARLPVTFHLCDYRDTKTYNPNNILFDKVVSVGLCEHVGPKNYQNFMQIANKNLKKDGLFLLHTIGKNVSDYYVDPWIDKYIFPNGMLPSLAQLAFAWENVFVLEDLHNISADYDKTLMAWHHNFIENWPSLREAYGEAFYRLWNYYLLSCAGAFRARGMQLWQMVLSPHGVLGGYESVR